jgi:hypothetical protein
MVAKKRILFGIINSLYALSQGRHWLIQTDSIAVYLQLIVGWETVAMKCTEHLLMACNLLWPLLSVAFGCQTDTTAPASVGISKTQLLGNINPAAIVRQTSHSGM